MKVRAMTSSVDHAALLPLPSEVEKEIGELARRARKSHGPLMKLVNFAGSKAEDFISALPDAVKDTIEETTSVALERIYDGAMAGTRSNLMPDIGKSGHAVASVMTGAAGGFAGLSTAIVELPVTISIMFAAIQKAARNNGFDPDRSEIKRECLLVFGSGDPLDKSDDGSSTGFLTSRVIVNGATVQGIIATVAPRLAVVLTEKLASQTLPILGSVTGATINFAFTSYYQELAEIRFALLRLSERYGEGRIRLSFNSAAAEQKRLERRT